MMGDESNEPNGTHVDDTKGNKREAREIYRPGALKDDRDKHRQRAHFGENKLPPQNQENRENRGANRRGGGFGRSRGSGVRNRPDRNNSERRSFERMGSDSGDYESFKSNPPVSTNWADEEYEEEQPQPVIENGQKSNNDQVFDLREKLNSMRLDRNEQHHEPTQHHQQQHQQQHHQQHKQQNQQQQYHNQRHNRDENTRPYNGNKQWPPSNNSRQSAAGNLPRPKKNTESFEPSYVPPEMRILCAPEGLKTYNRPYSSRDVLMVNDLFCKPDDYTLYQTLLKELENSGVTSHQLWQLWHGDSHVIADDKRKWKKECPTFMMIVDKLAEYFNMDIKATRLNWYRDSTEWKPFHFDAAAVKADKAQTQNFTVAVSLGLERDVAFEHAKTKTIISMPQPNGTTYTFGRDVNILWRHGIPQIPPDKHKNEGRISIIAWGWIPQFDL